MTPIALRHFFSAVLLAATLAAWPLSPVVAQTTADAQLRISWEVRNRFRLFREERDFQLHVESERARGVLASERALELQSDGRGWARNMVNRLCIDLQGRVSEPCNRDNVKESYLTPIDHPIVVRLDGVVPVGATCAWSFDDGDGPQQSTLDCAEPINLRVRYGRETVATVDVSGGAASQRISTEIRVRDIFIAGLGDSIASGEGNPDRPIGLSDEGFLLPLLFQQRHGAVLSSEPRRLQRRPRLRSAGYAPGLAAPSRVVAQLRLPSFVVQLPDANRAGPCRAISPHCHHLFAARLHRRHHCRRIARRAARAGMSARQIRQLRGHGECPAGRIARSRHRRKAPSARPQARPGAAVDRSQRHPLLRPRRGRDRRCAYRTGPVQTHRRRRFDRRVPGGSGPRPAAGLRQAARSVEAAGRRHVPCRLRVLRQSHAGRWRRPLPRRPRRVRHPPLLQRRAGAACRRLQLRAERVSAAIEGGRALPVGHPVPRSRAATA